MKILHGADEILPFVGPILGIETSRQLYYALERGQVPGAFRENKRDQWHLMVEAFERGLLKKAGMPLPDATRTPDARMVEQGDAS
ncbi:hypothetical protein [Nitratireductor luteus]|uniref:hypothetical protein n=1 Tax=Nitratireductor luteus TaxID=2976980 RepID=UPI00223EC2E6|nr:hypothetical protein [Nitratireductor luteus]